MNHGTIRKPASFIILLLFVFTNSLYATPVLFSSKDSNPTLRAPLLFDLDMEDPKDDDAEVQTLMAYIAGEELPELEERHFGEDLGLMKSMVKDFAKREIEPNVREWEDAGTHRDGDEIVAKALEGVLGKLAELGIFGISVPKEYEGTGYSDYFTYCMVELFSYTWPSLAVTLGVDASVKDTINGFGTEAQKEKYLQGLAKQGLGAIAITEPGAGSDVMRMRTFAQKQGDKWILDTIGQSTSKRFITSAGLASVYLVFAVTDKGEEGRKKRISAFLVDKDTPGLHIERVEPKMGQHASTTGELIFDHCEIPEENLLGEADKGMEVLFYMLTGGRIGIGSLALGIARAAYDAALQRAKERKQFKKPIIEFAQIEDKLNNMKFFIDSSELLIRYASYLKDQHPDDADEKNAMVTVASMAKLFASESGNSVTRDAIQIFGGDGYTEEYPVERFLRDVIVTTIYEGTSQIQQNIIQRYIELFLDPDSKVDIEETIDSYFEIYPTIVGYKQRMEAIYKAMDMAEKKLRKAVEEKKVTYRDADLLVPLVITRLMLFKAIFLANQGNVSETIVKDGFKNAVLASRLLRDSLAEYRNSASARSLLKGLDGARRQGNIRSGA